MAKITVKGFIGADAELRTVGEEGNTYSVCDFRICDNVKLRNGTTRAVWYKVTIWRKYAEVMAPLLKSGRKVQVEGTIVDEPKVYMTKDNQARAYVNIQGDDIDLLDAPKTEDDEAPWANVEE